MQTVTSHATSLLRRLHEKGRRMSKAAANPMTVASTAAGGRRLWGGGRLPIRLRLGRFRNRRDRVRWPPELQPDSQIATQPGGGSGRPSPPPKRPNGRKNPKP